MLHKPDECACCFAGMTALGRLLPVQLHQRILKFGIQEADLRQMLM
ncbi:hypothetical protein MHM84_20190 [Halomonas sp. McH1-25]|nr:MULTISPECIES: hypothetical protein [unclassified Halomonas]MCG7602066.1 hypothetical protein [Halomonas sp. McH1-25]MCP1342902.1 hypothetical protein [Halomonas sp. FL8]MCP1362521.1 hypothetical protein [Halomonas sp. BBD45]MCP1363644.1 hypothetical protein [Halomonas sp. BBD48]